MSSNSTIGVDDIFCGKEGFAWYFISTHNGRTKIFSDCVRELFFISPPHILFLIFVWIRVIALWEAPKKNNLLNYWTNQRPSILMKISTIVKFICIIICIIFVDVNNFSSLFLDWSRDGELLPEVFYLNDILKFASWVLCLFVCIMEWTRNRPHSIIIRIYWVWSLFASCMKQTQMWAILLDDQFTMFDISAILYQFVFASNLILALSGLLGLCLFPYIEVYGKTEEEIAQEKKDLLKPKNVNFSVRDFITIYAYGWYMITPGLVFAALQGYSTMTIAETAGSALAAAGQGEGALMRVMVHFLYLIPLATAGTFFQMFFIGAGGEVILRKIRNKLFKSFTLQDLPFFSEVGTGFLVSRLTTDVDIMGMALTVQLSLITPPLVELIVGSEKLVRNNWRASLLVMGLLLITLVITFVRSRVITQRFATFYSDSKAKSTKKATECIYGISTVRSFGKDGEEYDKHGKLLNSSFRIGALREFIEAFFEAGEVGFNSFVIVVFLYYGATLVMIGLYTSERLNEFLLVGISTIKAFMHVIRIAPEFYKASGSAARVLEIIRRKPKVDIDKGTSIPEEEFSGHIQFKNITFCYPSFDYDSDRDPQPILKNFSLDIPAGSSVALVGSSGSGKSTVLSLILRFYDIEQGNGEILLDGYDIRSLKARWLLSQIGVVSQMPFLFDGTIEENVKYSCSPGSEEFNDQEKFWNAIEGANAEAVVGMHEEREKFGVGERGENLSGGQRQRISIARCFRKNPKMLILDEVTSALDPESEDQVMKGLKNLMKGKTSVIVAHRLHTIVDVDKIVVMHKGEIVEQGNHKELMEKKGYYADLFNKQQALNEEQKKNPEAHNQSSKIDTQNLNEEIERLISSLRSHNCFENDELKRQVERISKTIVQKSGPFKRKRAMTTMAQFHSPLDNHTRMPSSSFSMARQKKKDSNPSSNLIELLSADTLENLSGGTSKSQYYKFNDEP